MFLKGGDVIIAQEEKKLQDSFTKSFDPTNFKKEILS